MEALQLANIHKRFGDFVALHDVSLNVHAGELLCFLGPSGCGKTTLLRIIAGLEVQTAGTVMQRGRDISRLPWHAAGRHPGSSGNTPQRHAPTGAQFGGQGRHDSTQVVNPPVGAVIATLPTGCKSVRVGNIAYTQCGTTYYQRVATGYQVVVLH